MSTARSSGRLRGVDCGENVGEEETTLMIIEHLDKVFGARGARCLG